MLPIRLPLQGRDTAEIDLIAGESYRIGTCRTRSDRYCRASTNVWTLVDLAARADLFIRRIANTQNLELEHDFPATKRIVSIDC